MFAMHFEYRDVCLHVVSKLRLQRGVRQTADQQSPESYQACLLLRSCAHDLVSHWISDWDHSSRAIICLLLPLPHPLKGL